jgi:hypothetical protein
MINVIVVAASAVPVAIPPLPTTATTLLSCRCCRRYSTAKTKALDDNDIGINRQGICYTRLLGSKLFTIGIRFYIINGNGLSIIKGKGCQFPPSFFGF